MIKLFNYLKKDYQETDSVLMILIALTIDLAVYTGGFVVVVASLTDKDIWGFFKSQDVLFLYENSHIYVNRWMNYVPLSVFFISLFGMIKTLITGKCCILKGLSFNKVIQFNFEICVIFLIPYAFAITIYALVNFILFISIGFSIGFLYKYINTYFENIKEKYDTICPIIDNTKKEEKNEN